MVIVVFRFHANPEASMEDLGALTEKMGALVSQMSGFIGLKDFSAEDGEVAVIAEFDSLETVDEWKAHPEHVDAQQQGRKKFFTDYRVQVCDLIRTQEFSA